MRNQSAGFSLVEVTLAAALFCLLLLGALRVHTDSALPQQAFAWDQIQALRIGERVMQRIRGELLSRRVVPLAPADQDLTAAMLDDPDFRVDLARFAGGVQHDGRQVVVNWRLLYRLEEAGTMAADGEPAAGVPAAVAGHLRRITVRVHWGLKPRHAIALCTLVHLP